MTPGLCPGRYRWAANNINRVTHEGTSHTDTRSPARPRQLAPESGRSRRRKVQTGSSPPGTGWVRVGGLGLVSRVFLSLCFFVFCFFFNLSWSSSEVVGGGRGCPTGGWLFLRECVFGTKSVPPTHRAAAPRLSLLKTFSSDRKDAPAFLLPVSLQRTHEPPSAGANSYPGVGLVDPVRTAILHPTSWPMGCWDWGACPRLQQPEDGGELILLLWKSPGGNPFLSGHPCTRLSDTRVPGH